MVWVEYVVGGGHMVKMHVKMVSKKEDFEEVETGSSNCMANGSGGSVSCISSRLLGEVMVL